MAKLERKLNWNDVARDISELEGKKVQVNIAQIKEVLSCFRTLFRRYPVQLMKLLTK